MQHEDRSAQPTPSAHAADRGTTVGIDLCADRLDLHAEPAGTSLGCADDARGRLAVRICVRRLASSRAALEPTGRCHDPLHLCLAASGIVVPSARAGERVFQWRTARPAYDR